MLKRIAVALLLNFLAATTLLAQVGAEVLKQVPDSALAVVVINRLGATSAKIEDIGKRLHVPVPGLLPIAKLRFGLGDGLDDAGSLAVAIMNRDGANGATPELLIVAPVSDYAKFLGQLAPENADASPTRVMIAGQPAHVARKGDFAILAKDEATLKMVLEAKRSVGDVAASLAVWQVENDIVALATPAGIGYSLDAMQTGLAGAMKNLDQLDAATKPAVEMYFNLIKNVGAQARSDLECVAIGLQATEGNLISSLRATFKADSSWDRSAKQTKLVESDLFTGLPAGPFVFVMGMGAVSNWIEPMSDLSVEMIRASTQQGPKPMTDEQAKRLLEVYRPMMKQLQGMAMHMTASRPGAGFLSGSIVLMRVDSAKEYLTSLEHYSTDYQKIAADLKSPMLPGYVITKSEIAGRPSIEFKVDIGEVLKAQPNPDAAKFLEKFFGPGGTITGFAVVLDEHTVLSGYDRETIEQYVKNPPTTSLTNDASLVKTAMLLPAGAQFVGYLDPRGLMQIGNDIMRAVQPEAKFQIPEFPTAPPIGFAARLSVDGFEMRKAVPAETLEAFGTFIDAARQMQLNQ